MTTWEQSESPALRAELRAYLVRSYFRGSAPEEVGDDHPLLGEEGVDSMGILELIVHLEETYGIRIAEEEVTPENFGDIGRAIEFVTAKVEAR